MINSEDDVRAWVREASRGKARWVEPALGSTPGLPDCWVPLKSEREVNTQVHIELKAGKIVNGVLKYTVRPEQRKQIIEMKDDGCHVGLLVGLKRSKTMFFIKPCASALAGTLSLRDDSTTHNWVAFDMGGGTSFWHGVNFIFSDDVI